MKKVTLNAEELTVESFVTEASGARPAMDDGTFNCGATHYPTCFLNTPRQEDVNTNRCC